jgi:hypothetical protein
MTTAMGAKNWSSASPFSSWKLLNALFIPSRKYPAENGLPLAAPSNQITDLIEDAGLTVVSPSVPG